MASITELKLRMLLVFTLIFGTLFALLAIAGAYFGLDLATIVIFTLIFAGIQWYASPWLVTWMAHLRYLQPGENPWLEQNVKQLAEQAGVPMPRLAISPDPSPNAFVFGRTRGSMSLAVHQGILNRLTKDELYAVLAHEVGHIRHNDAVVMTIVSVAPMLAYQVARYLMWGSFGSRNGKKSSIGSLLLIGIGAYVVYFITQLLVLALSRSRESFADAYSAYATGSPGTLASGLAKITFGLAVSHDPPDGLRSFYFADPVASKQQISSIMDNASKYDLNRDGSLDESEIQKAMEEEAKQPLTKLFSLFGTHPNPLKRIQYLKAMEQDVKRSKMLRDDFYRFV